MGGGEVGSCDWKDLNPNKDTKTSMVYLYTVLTGTQAAVSHMVTFTGASTITSMLILI